MATGSTTLLDRIGMLQASLPETPLIRLDERELELYAKLEFSNPNGSSKDRSAFWILKRAVERGDIGAGTTIIESSSGNFAISLATFCLALGIDFVPVLDPSVNAATEKYLRMTCPRVEKVSIPDASGGYLATRLARVRELLTEIPRGYWTNQYANADAVEAHYRLTGGELCRSLPKLDYLFVGVSTGGTVAGLSRRTKESYPGVRIVAVDAEGSAIFGQAPSRRRIPGLGSSIVPPLFHQALIDEVVVVSEREAIAGCHELLQQHGLYAGGSTGSVYSAIRSYFADRPPTAEPPVVAFLCADRGHAYADTIYNPSWVEEHFGAGAVRPVEVVLAR